MACDLAIHFLKQGTYTEEGDVAILVGNSSYTCGMALLMASSAHMLGELLNSACRFTDLIIQPTSEDATSPEGSSHATDGRARCSSFLWHRRTGGRRVDWETGRGGSSCLSLPCSS